MWQPTAKTLTALHRDIDGGLTSDTYEMTRRNTAHWSCNPMYKPGMVVTPSLVRLLDWVDCNLLLKIDELDGITIGVLIRIATSMINKLDEHTTIEDRMYMHAKLIEVTKELRIEWFLYTIKDYGNGCPF